MASALGGIRVLDLTGLSPASFAAGMLGDMGADVIRISTPPGASQKGVGSGVDFIEGMDAPALLDTPRNKRNIGINLKAEPGRELFHRLAETADVVVESFRPGVMARLGIDYETVSGKNPRIIFCSVWVTVRMAPTGICRAMILIMRLWEGRWDWSVTARRSPPLSQKI
ncbi:MAG: CoA transferase [Dehalococcoidia bacterium]